jgi:hypothetical protein
MAFDMKVDYAVRQIEQLLAAENLRKQKREIRLVR